MKFPSSIALPFRDKMDWGKLKYAWGCSFKGSNFFTRDRLCLPETGLPWPTVIKYSRSRAESGQALCVIQHCATILIGNIQKQKRLGPSGKNIGGVSPPNPLICASEDGLITVIY